MAESKADEHKRLQRRTEDLLEDHKALDRNVAPFDKADHDEHSENLRQHKGDLEKHKARPDDDTSH